MAPVSEPAPLLTAAGGSPTSEALVSYAVSAYSRVYPDVKLERYVRPGAASIVRSVASRCLEGTDPGGGLSRRNLMADDAVHPTAVRGSAGQAPGPERPVAADRGPAADRPGPGRRPGDAGDPAALRAGTLRSRAEPRIPHLQRAQPHIADGRRVAADSSLFEWTRLRLDGSPASRLSDRQPLSGPGPTACPFDARRARFDENALFKSLAWRLDEADRACGRPVRRGAQQPPCPTTKTPRPPRPLRVRAPACPPSPQRQRRRTEAAPQPCPAPGPPMPPVSRRAGSPACRVAGCSRRWCAWHWAWSPRSSALVPLPTPTNRARSAPSSTARRAWRRR